MVARQAIGGIRKCGLQLVIGMMLLILPIQAQAVVGVTAKVGTTGLGGDVTLPLVSNWMNLRAGYNFGELRPSITEAGIKYKADVHLDSVPILLDLHPFHGGFRVTAGVYYNKNDMDLSSTVGPGTEIGGIVIPPGLSTTLNGHVSWSKEFAPYLGVGWGNAAGDDNVGFSLDIGAYYQGSPDVLLTESSGLVPPADLLLEQQQLEDDLSDFKFYPVITVGIYIRF